MVPSAFYRISTVVRGARRLGERRAPQTLDSPTARERGKSVTVLEASTDQVGGYRRKDGGGRYVPIEVRDNVDEEERKRISK